MISASVNDPGTAFWRRLVTSGLASDDADSPDALASWQRAFARAGGGDAEAFGRWALKENRLVPFQTATLLDASIEPVVRLRLGPAWRTGPVGGAGLPGWLPVRLAPPGGPMRGGGGVDGWLKALPPADLTADRWRSIVAAAAVQDPRLQLWRPIRLDLPLHQQTPEATADAASGPLAIFSPIAAGRMAERLPTEPADRQRLAAAAGALASAGFRHQRIAGDRVWQSDGGVVLLRDVEDLVAADEPAPAPAPAPTPAPAPAPEPAAEFSSADRRRLKQRQRVKAVLGAMCLPPVLLLIALALQPDAAPRRRPARVIPAVTDALAAARRTVPAPRPAAPPPPPPPPPAPPVRRGDMEIVQDEAVPWAPPELISADGAAIAPDGAAALAAMLPPGPSALISLRPGDLADLGAIAAFQAETTPWIQTLRERGGVPIEQIRRLTLGLYGAGGRSPSVSLAVTLNDPVAAEALLRGWDVTAARTPGGGTVYAGGGPDDPAYFLPIGEADLTPETMIDQFAVGSIDQITEVAEARGAAVTLPPVAEALWELARADDAIAFWAAPAFLVSEAGDWTASLSPGLLDWCRRSLVPRCSGVLIRVATLAGQPPGQSPVYLEWRLAPSPGTDPGELTAVAAGLLDSSQSWASSTLAERQIDPSWQPLAARLSAMWALAGSQVRRGRGNDQVFLNAYLPPAAVPQIALATMLAEASRPAAALASSTAAAEPLTLQQWLRRPVTVRFEQESLESALQLIAMAAADAGPEGQPFPPVRLIGGDLQKLGITQNQQIRGFDQSQTPLADVLTQLVLDANPDRTAAGPSDPKQTLVWAIDPAADPPAIVVTTRPAAVAQYRLPERFGE